MKRVLRLGAVAVFVSACLAATGDADAWNREIAQAEATIDDDDSSVAIGHLRTALAIAEKFGESDPRLLESVARLSNACQYAEGCKADESANQLKRGMALRAGVVPRGESAAAALIALAEAAAAQDKHREALLVWRDVLDIREKHSGVQSRATAEVWVRMAWVYQWSGDKVQARRTYEHALELRRQAGAARSAELVDMQIGYGGMLLQQNANSEACVEYDKALALATQLWNATDERALSALLRVAQAASRPLPAYAETQYRRLVDLRRPAGGEAYAEVLRRYAEFQRRQKRDADAERLLIEAVRVAPYGDKQADRLACLAEVQEALQKLPEATATAQCLLDFGVRSKWPFAVIAAHARLARLYAKQRDTRRAGEHFDALRQLAQSESPDQLISSAEELAKVYRQQQDNRRAGEMYELAIANREAGHGAESEEMADDLMQLSAIYAERGRGVEALGLQRRAFGILWRQFRAQQQGKSSDTALLIAVVLLLGVGGVVTVVFGIASILVIRSGDRKLQRLYKPTWELGPDTPPPPPAVPQSLGFHGEGAALLGLRIINLSLSLLTAGVYSFWGKARIRRYLCGQAEYDNDRLAFHGTGGELLRGWLRGLPILATLILLPYLVPIVWPKPLALVVGQYVVLFAVMLLWPVARAGAYRYRLNRMSWRAIRFSFRGSTLRFFLMHLSGYALSFVTFGIYRPIFDNRVREYLYTRTYFGDRCFAYTGTGSSLVAAYFFSFPFTLLTAGLFWPWFSAYRARYYWAHTTFSNARFRCTATGFGLFKLWTGNVLMIVGTLGIAMPWVTIRTMRYWATHIEWTGDLDLANIRQDERATGATGESFADFLGFDFGI